MGMEFSYDKDRIKKNIKTRYFSFNLRIDSRYYNRTALLNYVNNLLSKVNKFE